MGCYLVPSYIKPYSKILSWTIPMVYIDNEGVEYISDLPFIKPFLKDTTTGFRTYYKTVMSKDLRGIAERFKISIEQGSGYLLDIEEFVEIATGGKQYGKLNMDVNLLSSGSTKFIEAVYDMLDVDLRAVISTPTQWLVYVPKEKLLTRLCWVVEFGGEIVVRPYGERGILLEVSKLKLDKVNTPSLREIKKNALIKQRVNDFWRRLLATQQAVEEARELLEFAETGEEVGEAVAKSEEIGTVE